MASLVTSELLENLVPVALEASRAVMAVFNSDFAVIEKDDKSPVTEADRRGEVILESGIRKLLPDVQIIGEEAVSDGAKPPVLNDTFFLLDPLDGTKEFIKRGTDFTVNIGLIEKGKPVLGIVVAPARGIIWAGASGHGAFKAETDLTNVAGRKAISVRDVATPMTIVASKSHRSAELEAWLSHYSDAENISCGSSLKLVMVGEGSADLYPRIGPTCEWDTAAADAVLRAAGGITVTGDGTPLDYGKDVTTFLNPYFLCKGQKDLETPAF